MTRSAQALARCICELYRRHRFITSRLENLFIGRQREQDHLSRPGLEIVANVMLNPAGTRGAA